MRNRALIARWAFGHGREEGVAELVKRDGKTYVCIRDYERLRELFGLLLREIQRIKSEGDYEAARDLVERYGVKTDPACTRKSCNATGHCTSRPTKALSIRYTHRSTTNKRKSPTSGWNTASYDAQMLRYSRGYATLPYCNE